MRPGFVAFVVLKWLFLITLIYTYFLFLKTIISLVLGVLSWCNSKKVCIVSPIVTDGSIISSVLSQVLVPDGIIYANFRTVKTKSLFLQFPTTASKPNFLIIVWLVSLEILLCYTNSLRSPWYCFHSVSLSPAYCSLYKSWCLYFFIGQHTFDMTEVFLLIVSPILWSFLSVVFLDCQSFPKVLKRILLDLF